jgi:fumarate reductase subunit D
MNGYRKNVLWMAAMIHRLSGLALAIFLPLHFWALGTALEAERFDAFLSWTQNPLLKLTEMALAALLTVHLLGGLRLLWLENMPWHDRQRQLATAAGAVAIVVGGAFLMRALS